MLKKGHLKLGVRFATSNPQLAAEFARALDFRATVLDMEWREDNGRSCAIQIVDGRPGRFIQPQAARAQLPSRPAFQGWIAFNPHISLPANEDFFIAVHELGHILKLPHNSSAWPAIACVSLVLTSLSLLRLPFSDLQREFHLARQRANQRHFLRSPEAEN